MTDLNTSTFANLLCHERGGTDKKNCKSKARLCRLSSDRRCDPGKKAAKNIISTAPRHTIEVYGPILHSSSTNVRHGDSVKLQLSITT